MITSKKLSLNKELSYPISLSGGLNEQVANMELNPGELISCSNYIDLEDIYSGYQSVRGYERYDGQSLASEIEVETFGIEDEDEIDDSEREGQRALIKAVGDTDCTGSCTGVHLYDDVIYAWRNKSDDSETLMYKATNSSWSAISLGSDTMEPNASVRALNGRFSSYNTNLEVMVWVDGVTKGVYFYNGTTVSFIDNTSTSGYLPDIAPINLGIWKNRLFLIYPNGHILFSAAGDPTNFNTATSYAGEIYLGDDCTDIQEGPSSTLALFTKDTTKLLYYESTTDDFVFKLDTFAQTVGAKERTAKNILGNIFFADGQGLCSLSTVQTYGDFGAKNISKKVQTTYKRYKDYIQFAIADIDTGRYYLYYSDPLKNTTSALVFTFKGTNLKGSTRIQYKHKLSCVTEARYNNGNKEYFCGDDRGYVLKLFSGTSFDGEPIDTIFSTSFFHYKTPRLWKFFHRLKFEVSATNNFNCFIRTKFNYSESIMPRTVQEDFSIIGAAGYYGEDYWGKFYWSSAAIGGSMYYFTGYGTNMSITIQTSSKFKNTHAFHNFTVDYSIQSVQP